MSALKLAEHFVSINGEGQLAGALALFLRFAGCNLKCDWCDTMWANEKDAPYELASISRLTDIAQSAIEQYDLHCVTLTGGEPLLQEDIDKLIFSLTKLGLRVEIETNGAVPIEKMPPCFHDGLQAAVKQNGKVHAHRQYRTAETMGYAQIRLRITHRS